MTSTALLVSIHDVTPAYDAAVKRLWSLCRAHSLVPALLVVPDWHGQWPLSKFPTYVEWLLARAKEGAEIALHGYRHDEDGLSRGLIDHVRAVGRTNREGEFLTLDSAAARSRIDSGLAVLRGLGLAPIGFIPPAWLARESTHAAVRAAGLAFSEDAWGVRVHSHGARVAAPALRWSGRTSLRAKMSAAVASARWNLHRNARYVRLALHPQDLDHPVTAASVEREVARWAKRGRQVRYDSL